MGGSFRTSHVAKAAGIGTVCSACACGADCRSRPGARAALALGVSSESGVGWRRAADPLPPPPFPSLVPQPPPPPLALPCLASFTACPHENSPALGQYFVGPYGRLRPVWPVAWSLARTTAFPTPLHSISVRLTALCLYLKMHRHP